MSTEVEQLDDDDTGTIWEAAFIGSLKGVMYYYEEDASNINSVHEELENWTPLHFACIYQGNYKIVKFLLSKGADVNALNSDKETPLMWACFDGDLPVIELLLKHGADINIQSVEGWTALHWAIKAKCFQVIRFLVEMGANLNLKHVEYGTPAAYADYLERNLIFTYLTECLDL